MMTPQEAAQKLREIAAALEPATEVHTLKVGDLVRYKGGNGGPDPDTIGVIREDSSGKSLGVEWADFHSGHALNGYLSSSSKKGWYVPARMLELA